MKANPENASTDHPIVTTTRVPPEEPPEEPDDHPIVTTTRVPPEEPEGDPIVTTTRP